MDAITPKSKHDTLDTHSHVVRPAQLEWKKTRFPGCEVKGLLFDKESGVVTALMRFTPGAVLPDHEHVKIEQTYVLEGRLVDKEGPAEGLSVGPGEFVWREAGSRHVACTPEGGLMLAMFQVPNKFFENDGRVTDLSGEEWDKLWGGVAETLELVGGAGRTWTNEEKLAGAANGRQLTQSGPPPQTVYRVAQKAGGSLLVTVPLRYAR